ncbi:MAG: aminotransferase class V-fold PLP-dependent enzyme [Ignavibacteria bacterium]|nr:aminotransferase class V-fold PLP-dependent enzyme [Ignavibacteria bacterium]
MIELYLNRAREYFPHIKKGIIYFNHAASGPVNINLRDDINSLLKKSSEGSIDDYFSFKEKVDDSKNLLGEMLNCSADRIAFIDNTSNGLNILAQGVKWKKEDRILLNDVEFPANVYPFLNLKEQGIEIDFVKSNDGIVTAEDVIEAVKPGTRLISISYVQFLSGYRVDLKKIGKFCKENDIILSVDAIQGLGAATLDVKECNVNFLSCGTQKWMLGVQGLAFIYIEEDLQNKIKTVPLGWLSVNNAWDFLDYKIDLRSTASRYQPGTLNVLGIYAFNTSLKLFKEFGFKNIEQQIISNTVYFNKLLADVGFEPILLNYHEENIAGIVSFRSNKSENIFNHLSEKNIICSERLGYIRLSPHFYNTKSDINKVVDEIRKI